MGFMDKLRGNRQSATLPRGAKVVRRRRSYGNRQVDTGYWYNEQFFLIDGTLCDSQSYERGQGQVLSTNEARSELSDAGYQADTYTAPSTSGATSTYSDQAPSYGGSGHYSEPSPSYGGGHSSGGYGSSDSGSGSSSSDSGSY